MTYQYIVTMFLVMAQKFQAPNSSHSYQQMKPVIWVLLRIIHINKDPNVFQQKGVVQQDCSNITQLALFSFRYNS